MNNREVIAYILNAKNEGLRELDLSKCDISSLPDCIADLTEIRSLSLRGNHLESLPEAIGELTMLERLDLAENDLVSLPKTLIHLTHLKYLDASNNGIRSLPETIGELSKLQVLLANHNALSDLPISFRKLDKLWRLELRQNRIVSLPTWLGELRSLDLLCLTHNIIRALPTSIGELSFLRILRLDGNMIELLPDEIGKLRSLRILSLKGNLLKAFPALVSSLTQLEELDLGSNKLESLPVDFAKFQKLKVMVLSRNCLADLPSGICDIPKLTKLDLEDNELRQVPACLGHHTSLGRLLLDKNPLRPALASAYAGGFPALMSYLGSLVKKKDVETLYEAKLILVGEGKVGKTTLLRALMGLETDESGEEERTTHGIQIDLGALQVEHPEDNAAVIKLNAWDFGGQEVYRPTHQFFFSPRSIYLLVWEPRRGVSLCQVEAWLKLIRLRVGDDARVIVVSTHCQTGGRIAQIDKPVLASDFEPLIVDFVEVDSLVVDSDTNEKVGVVELKEAIARASAGLSQMGMHLSRNWREARDELLALTEARISFPDFEGICGKHGLKSIDAETLALLMHDLGYIVHYGDDERLRGDVILQPEWLTKAIGYVLEDQVTKDMDGILPDSRLKDVWWNHPFQGEPRYESNLYPFFLRLMERYDVSYRLPDGQSSLVAQHVPQVRPSLPWLPEDTVPDDLLRIQMVCSLEEDPPGLMPWMIVRTHDYATNDSTAGDESRRLHWEKGTFLRFEPHGEALLEMKTRELRIWVQAEWPAYFLNILQHTLRKLIDETWPGMEGRYSFSVPCSTRVDNTACGGRFRIDALRAFYSEGDRTIRCQECTKQLSIDELLFGFERHELEKQLAELKEAVDGFASKSANQVMTLMRAIASEAKHGPRLFTVTPADQSWITLPTRPFAECLHLRLWCEAEGCQHPVFEAGKGSYEFSRPRTWFRKTLPYMNFALAILKVAANTAGPAASAVFGKNVFEEWDYEAHLEVAETLISSIPEIELPGEEEGVQLGIGGDSDRAGLLALHRLLAELDPNQSELGLTRVATYTGDYRWLCKTHYAEWQSTIPDVISDEANEKQL